MTKILELRQVEEESAPEDRKPSKEDLMKEPINASKDNPPPPEAVAWFGNEFTIKQEWVEQCERRRPPLKERYQLQL